MGAFKDSRVFENGKAEYVENCKVIFFFGNNGENFVIPKFTNLDEFSDALGEKGWESIEKVKFDQKEIIYRACVEINNSSIALSSILNRIGHISSEVEEIYKRIDFVKELMDEFGVDGYNRFGKGEK